MPTDLPTDRKRIEAEQLQALQKLIRALLDGNRFYGPRLEEAGIADVPQSLAAFTARCPFTTKQQLAEDQHAHPPYGTNLTFPLEDYSRFNQTSGTTGKPLRWLDTTASWQTLLDHWRLVFAAAGVTARDRIFFPFSFGPFLGFWTAFEAATQLGALCIPGGGMSSEARLRTIADNEVTALCATPTYAIHLGQKAKTLGLDTSRLTLRTIIVAGEPGGSLPAVRQTLKQLWPTATVRDHHGMTEVGPVTFENAEHAGVLHIIDSAYFAEVLNVETHEPVAPGSEGELVLTTLKRIASPLLRYRTGDLVRLHRHSGNAAALGNAFTALDGGILSRCDDMVLIRGVNVYPSAVDQIVRQVEGVAEYRVSIEQSGALTEMRIEVEPEDGIAADAVCEALSRALREALHLRVPVHAVEAGALPRFELKAKRWVRR